MTNVIDKMLKYQNIRRLKGFYDCVFLLIWSAYVCNILFCHWQFPGRQTNGENVITIKKKKKKRQKISRPNQVVYKYYDLLKQLHLFKVDIKCETRHLMGFNNCAYACVQSAWSEFQFRYTFKFKLKSSFQFISK